MLWVCNNCGDKLPLREGTTLSGPKLPCPNCGGYTPSIYLGSADHNPSIRERYERRKRGETPSESACEYNKTPICPHCGAAYNVDSEDFSSSRDEIDVDCSECDESFTIYREIEITYTTRKITKE